MGFAYNPLTGQLQIVGSGGGGTSYSEYNLGSTLSGSVALNFSNGAVQAGTVTGNVSFGSISNMPAGATLFLELVQGGTGNYTYSFSDTVYWGNPGAPAPSLSGRKDRIAIYKPTSTPQYYEGSYIVNYQTPVVANNYSTSFNGTNQWVNLGNNINPEYNQAFTWIFWVKPNGLSGTQNFIAKLIGGNPDTGYSIGVTNTFGSGKVQIDLMNNPGTAAMQCHSNSPLTGSVWQQVAVTYDGSNNANGIALYVNGSSSSLNIDVNNMSGTMVSNSSFLFFGADYSGGSQNYYHGLMDEITYYNAKLSSSDITALYNSGGFVDPTTVFPSASHLQNWWRMGDPNDSATATGGFVDRVGSVNGSGVNMTSGNFTTDVP